MSCPKIVESVKMDVEIANHGHDSPICSLKLPDPWLFDSEALLREIARCRETVLQVPITNPNATHFGLQLAVSALWNLEENIRYLLHLHRERQRAVRKKHRTRGSKEHQTIYDFGTWLLSTCWYFSSYDLRPQ